MDQLGEIQRLLSALAEGGNRFYAEKLEGLTSVASLEEFCERVPFTTKQELAADNWRILRMARIGPFRWRAIADFIRPVGRVASP